MRTLMLVGACALSACTAQALSSNGGGDDGGGNNGDPTSNGGGTAGSGSDGSNGSGGMGSMAAGVGPYFTHAMFFNEDVSATQKSATSARTIGALRNEGGWGNGDSIQIDFGI